MGSRCQAERSKEHSELTRGHMQCGRLSPQNLRKNRKLNWMMIVVVAQKSHCVELTGIMGLKWNKQLTSHIMDAGAHGCGAASINLTHHQRDCRGCGVRRCNKWPRRLRSGRRNAPWFLRMHCPNRIFPSHHISLFWLLSKTQPSGLPCTANLH